MASENDWVSIFVCPRCQQRCIRVPNTGDFEHDCFGNDSLANEDVLVLGQWQDYTGSNANVQQALIQGTENTLQQSRAGLEGAKFQPRDKRGFPTNRFRVRRHIEYIHEDKFKVAGIKQEEPEIYEEK